MIRARVGIAVRMERGKKRGHLQSWITAGSGIEILDLVKNLFTERLFIGQ